MLAESISYIKITDLSGRELYCTITTAGYFTALLKHLHAGEYFISITNNTGTQIQKLIKA